MGEGQGHQGITGALGALTRWVGISSVEAGGA